MERVRRIWWLAILLPAPSLATGHLGPGMAAFLSVLGVLAFAVWVDWHDARGAARQVARQGEPG